MLFSGGMSDTDRTALRANVREQIKATLAKQNPEAANKPVDDAMIDMILQMSAVDCVSLQNNKKLTNYIGLQVGTTTLRQWRRRRRPGMQSAVGCAPSVEQRLMVLHFLLLDACRCTWMTRARRKDCPSTNEPLGQQTDYAGSTRAGGAWRRISAQMV